MSFSRYSRAAVLNFGEKYGTSEAINTIRFAIKEGRIRAPEMIVRGAERLDTLAGSIYGDGRLWWILAAASNIGWAPQVPPGTVLLVPDVNDIATLVS